MPLARSSSAMVSIPVEKTPNHPRSRYTLVSAWTQPHQSSASTTIAHRTAALEPPSPTTPRTRTTSTSMPLPRTGPPVEARQAIVVPVAPWSAAARDDVGRHLRAQVVRDRHRPQRVERHHRDLVARAELLLVADPAADRELDRAASEAGDRELEHQAVAEMARPEELAAGVDDREPHPTLDVHLVEREPDRLAEPVLDAAAHHVEEVDEVDDPRRVAVREPDLALGREDFGRPRAPAHFVSIWSSTSWALWNAAFAAGTPQ